eukprot:sb/3474547/
MKRVHENCALKFSTNTPPSLAELDLTSCAGLKEKSLKLLVSNLPLLTKLVLTDNRKISGECIVNNLRTNRLKHLSLDYCDNIVPRTFHQILIRFHNTLETLAIPAHVLKRLDRLQKPLQPLPKLNNSNPIEWKIFL